MYPAPRALPAPKRCGRCGEPTPTPASRMRHDELHAGEFGLEDC